MADVREWLRSPDADTLFAALGEQRALAAKKLLSMASDPASSMENIRYRAGMLDGIALSINTLRKLRGDD